MLMMPLETTRALMELARCRVLSSPSREVGVLCAPFQASPSTIIRRRVAGLEGAQKISAYGNGMTRLI